MKIHTAVLVEVAVALTMLSCTTPTSAPTSETTQQQRAEWEADQAWLKGHMKSGAMSRL